MQQAIELLKTEEYDFREFLTHMQQEKSYMPPVRVLFIGDDQQFNDFVRLYVEHVLNIHLNIKKGIDDQESAQGSEFESDSDLNIHRRTSRKRTQSQYAKHNTQVFNRNAPVNVDFRTFILPPMYQTTEECRAAAIRSDARSGRYQLETEDFLEALDSKDRKGKVNTLAHYISLNDDLYCQEIY